MTVGRVDSVKQDKLWPRHEDQSHRSKLTRTIRQVACKKTQAGESLCECRGIHRYAVSLVMTVSS